MKIIDLSLQKNGIRLQTSKGMVGLEVCSERVIRVRYTWQRQFADGASLMVIDRGNGKVPWTVEEDHESVVLRTAALRLTINRGTTAFAWHDAEGQLLVREPASGGKTLSQITVPAPLPSGGGGGGSGAGGAGEAGGERHAFHTRLELVFDPGEALYGLGSHEEGILNYRGRHQLLYQQNLKISLPVLLSTRGYGLLVDSCSLGAFHDDQYGSYFWTEVDDEMDFYFLYGPQFDTLVASLRGLTGAAGLLPRWAFGYIQSKERYVSQSELLEVVGEYRRRKIPLDAIVQDWQYWPGDLWGDKHFDPERFPDPAALCRQLHELNVRLMVSIWPHLRNDGPDQRELRERGLLLANDSTYNAFDSEARRVYWQQAHDGIFQHGVDAWWCDCSEPFEADWHGDLKMEPGERLAVNVGEAKRYLAPETINAYSLLHSQGIYEGQRAASRAKRVVNLTRSGYPGQQRYGTICWSGDVSARWETLARQISAGLNFCAAGLPYWTVDIGGFFTDRHDDLWFWNGEYARNCQGDKGYRELYTRWFQLGAFLPMLRAHGTDTAREIWQFGKPGDAFYDTLVRFVGLRYQLLPYIYSIARRVAVEGYTLMRLLAFDFRHDPAVYDIADQFMFGPAIMVCPVTTPMYYGPNSTKISDMPKVRSVYLPKGQDWFDFWTGTRLAGGQRVVADAPLEIMPLFVRAGAILPFGPIIQHADDGLGEPLELRIYAGSDGEFTFYEDAGDGYDFEQGAFALTHCRWKDATRTLHFAARQGDFPGLVCERLYHLVVVDEEHGRGVVPTSNPRQTVAYQGQALSVKL